MSRLSRSLVVTLLALGLAGAPPRAAEKSDEAILREIEALKQGQEAIQKQLEELKKLIQTQQQRPQAAAPARRGPEVANVVFSLGENEIKGKPEAGLTLLEFTDYQCPFCARHVRETYPQINKEYVETGKIRYVLMDLPLEQIHKQAFKASEATYCAKDQGKYWEMHDRLFENQRALEPWSAHAEAIGLDVAKFDACLNEGKHAPAIRADMQEATKAGITGTPGFVLARTDPKDPKKVTGLTFLSGAQPFTAFQAQIDQALSAAK